MYAIRSYYDVLGHRHLQDAVPLAPLRDHVHRVPALAEGAGPGTGDGRVDLQMVGLGPQGVRDRRVIFGNRFARCTGEITGCRLDDPFLPKRQDPGIAVTELV